MSANRLLLTAFVSLSLPIGLAAQTLHGPIPYLSRADSPFTDFVTLETFEDHLFNTPGVNADSGNVTSLQFSSLYDSVDADDGDIDGLGSSGDSYFTGSSTLVFSFDAVVLGGLPTRAGLVWTDGAGLTSFEAFDSFGASLGVVGPIALADGSFSGGTAEDHFFGVSFPGGISAISITNTSGGKEIDHLQFSMGTGTSIKGSESVRLGSPANPNALRPSLATPPTLGMLWAPRIDHTSFAVGATLDFLLVDPGPPINVSLPSGTLLCNFSGQGLFLGAAAGDALGVAVPNMSTLAGLAVCSQGASLTPGAGFELTNALDLILGTY